MTLFLSAYKEITMKLTCLSVFALLLTISSCSKLKDYKEAISYPGELSSIDSAELFAPGIISLDSSEHSAPSFSPDGRTVLWSFIEMPSWKASIVEMNYKNGAWSKPQRPSFADTSASEISPSFSPEGRILYFSSGRKLPSGQFPPKGNSIWVVEKTEAGWGNPQPLDSAVSKSGDYSPSVAKNGNLYFTHGPFRSPDWNIHMAESVNGKLSQAVKLSSSINTSSYEDGPFIAADESYLIFESNRPGGVNGSIDLYISFKSENGDWTTPLNMGPQINTAATERFAHVSPDGRYLFFGSNKRNVKGQPNFDIYWIDASIISRLKETGSR